MASAKVLTLGELRSLARPKMGGVSFHSMGARRVAMSPLSTASRIFARMARTRAGSAARSWIGSEIERPDGGGELRGAFDMAPL